MATRAPMPDYARAATPRRKLTDEELHTYQRKVAYRQGRAGSEAPADSAPDHVRDAYAEGRRHGGHDDPQETQETGEETGEETQETEETEETPSPSGPGGFRPLAGKDTAQNGAGIVLSILVYCVAVNYLRGGPKQVRQWFSAKFFNKTTAAAAGGTPKAPAPAQPSAPKAPPGMGVV